MQSKTQTRPRAEPLARLLPFERAVAVGLMAGKKTKHINAKVTPALFAAAAEKAGSQSPARVLEAALVALAARDTLGPWLARHRGVLAHVDPEIIEEISF